MHVIRGKDRHTERTTRDIFTGEVETLTYVDDTIGQHLRLTLVRFKAGGRTKWHHHAFEQGLVITEGKGIVATEAEEHLVEPGDIVIVPAGERHWHGGTESSPMAHISIVTPGETTVLEAVDQIRTRG
ncbi:MAG TPA: cupin domain-containing protein [Dehalococcoidia bacterium]